MENLRERITQNARAYNKYLVRNWLEPKTDEELLCLTHPVDRDSFEKELEKLEN